MNIFFDTEFTGLVPNTTLISVGMVAETGEKFYAEFTDYDRSLCDDWIEENVIANLRFKDPVDGEDPYYVATRSKGDPLGSSIYNGYSVEMQGDSATIEKELRKWIEQFISTRLIRATPAMEAARGKEVYVPDSIEPTPIQLVSDVCHYDMVLLCNLFGGAFNLPENVNPACYDICQDLVGENDDDIHDMAGAFRYSREDACKFYNQGRLPDGQKHNALYDAEVIKMIFERLNK